MIQSINQSIRRSANPFAALVPVETKQFIKKKKQQERSRPPVASKRRPPFSTRLEDTDWSVDTVASPRKPSVSFRRAACYNKLLPLPTTERGTLRSRPDQV